MASGMVTMSDSAGIWNLRSTGIAFIDWAKAQIQDFATMFRKQVYTSDVDPKTVEDALAITYTQSKKVRRNHYCAVAMLTRYYSCWKSSDSTSVSCSRSFLMKSRRRQLAPARFPLALTQNS